MIIRIPLFIFLLTICLQGFAQSYIPIPDTLAVWGQTGYEGYYPNHVGRSEQIRTAEKFITDSFTYTVLRRSGYGKFEPHDPTLTSYQNELFGLLRNDSAARKVYFRPAGQTTDKLLYDFSVIVGDSINHWYLATSHLKVKSEDLIWMFGKIRRRLIVEDYSNTVLHGSVIIEGIGCVSGFATPAFVAWDPSSYELDCFSYKDSAYSFSQSPTGYPTYSGTSCRLYSDIENTIESSPVFVFPNPVSDHLTVIVSQLNKSNSTELRVMDLAGRQVSTYVIASATETLDVKALLPGVYLWQIIADNKITGQGKLVKN
ncbi:MAG TPA: T9SS type A sorting domain-containing protein [Chitinophagales bacterium]|nr:T9SS type A sorting domain-containing protein [Chitinophagales bacterium]